MFDRTTPPRTLTLVLIMGVSALNMSVFLPSLNALAAHFDAPYAFIQLAVSAYLGVSALLQLVIGPISDRFGRRPVVMAGLAGFMIATLGCILAPTPEVFLICRLAQAVVVTCMVLSRAIVRDLYDTDQAASVLGYVTMGMALIPMVGPMIGGTLQQLFGWQAVFGFLLAAGAALLALVWADLGETLTDGGLSFHQQLQQYPELLRSQRFWGYALVSAFASGAFFALLGGASFVAERVFGLTPMQAGFGLGAPSIGYIVGNGLSGRLSARVGINPMIYWGSGITVVALAASLGLSLMGVTGPWEFFGFCVLLGLGNGMVLPNAQAGLLSVKPHLAGTASGLGGAIMIGGGALLSALAGALLTEASAIPLQAIMLASSIAGAAAAWWIHRRIQHLAA